MSRTEITLIGLDHANKTAQLGELIGNDHTTKKGVAVINGVAIEPQEHGGFRGFDAQIEVFDKL